MHRAREPAGAAAGVGHGAPARDLALAAADLAARVRNEPIVVVAESAFVLAVVVPGPEAAPEHGDGTPTSTASGWMVIALGRGRRIVVDAGVDAATLARDLDVLERR